MLIFNAGEDNEARINANAISALLCRADGGTDLLLTGGQCISVKPSIAAIRRAMMTRTFPKDGIPADLVVREIGAKEEGPE